MLDGLKSFFRPTAPEPATRQRRYASVRYGTRSFESADTNRLVSDWTSHPETIDSIVRKHQRKLVARSRDQYWNNDYARAFIRMCRQNIVGPYGVQLQAQSRDDHGVLDTKANMAIQAAFADWGKPRHCDIIGKQSWRQIQASAVQSLATDGEYFIREIVGSQAGKYGYALQMLDAQRCNPQFDQEKLPDGRFIRAGIEFNSFGKPLAYYFTVDDGDQAYTYSFSGKNYLRIPADEIIHGFNPEFIGQKRGLPWMATALFRLKQLEGFENAAITNARVGASKMGFIEWADGAGLPEEYEDQPLDLEIEASPGEFNVLPEGARLKEWSPQFPSNEFAGFNKAMLRGVSSGLGVAYNDLANDLEGVNFSSIRQGALDVREHWKELQEMVIEQLHDRVFEGWLPRALLAGLIMVGGRALKPERLARYSVVTWQPRRWAWIDPRAEVDAAIKSKNSLLASPGQIIREAGKDPESVWAEIAADIKSMEKAGIPKEYIQAAVLQTNFAKGQEKPQEETGGGQGQ